MALGVPWLCFSPHQLSTLNTNLTQDVRGGACTSAAVRGPTLRNDAEQASPPARLLSICGGGRERVCPSMSLLDSWETQVCVASVVLSDGPARAPARCAGGVRSYKCLIPDALTQFFRG